jgi:hypothetical protein
MRKLALTFLLITLAAPVWATGTPEQLASDKAVSDHLRYTFESQYLRLSPKARRHYSLRLWRLTGEKLYMTDIINDVYQISSDLNRYVRMLNDPKARRGESEQLISSIRKQEERKAALRDSGDLSFAMHLIYLLAKLDDLGLKHERQADLLNYLKNYPNLQRVMLEPEFIKVYAAEIANSVYWLKQLGVADLRDVFSKAMRRTYSDNKDANLSKKQFQNKIYGLTHIIIAASRYYQTDVDADRYRWITDYFLARQEQILEHASEDVMAEVALCLELAGQGDHPFVREVKEALKAEVHPRAGLIPSVIGKLDLSTGEHRNVLTIALLEWPEHRFKGPNLGNQSNLNLPFGLLPK